MAKIKGKKLKMTQVFDDHSATAVTPIKVDDGADFSELKNGDQVKVAGITKGHGFQGVVKRHGFHGGPKSHGQKNRLRAPGSIGNTATQRVIPGRRMAGHMGVVRVTTKNLKVMNVDVEKRTILIKGAVPGHTGSRVEISK